MDTSSVCAAVQSANHENGSDVLLAAKALGAALEHAVVSISGLDRDFEAASLVLRDASDAELLARAQSVVLSKEMRGCHQRAEAAARICLISGLRARAGGGSSSFELGYLWTEVMTRLEASLAALENWTVADAASAECC
jgi:hypothetical protein